MTDDIYMDIDLSVAPLLMHGLSVFHVPWLEFGYKQSSSHVVANLVSETARKFRMVTLGKPWYTCLTAVYTSEIRNMLKRDNSLRVGFEEAHKLWEFLKHMKGKSLSEQDYICSSDLSEATYRFANVIINEHMVIYRSAINRGQLQALIENQLLRRRRHVKISEQCYRDYKVLPEDDDYWTHNGTFMGEHFSFIDLTIFNDNCNFIAQCYTEYNIRLGNTDPDELLVHFPVDYNSIITFRNKKPPSQTAGDDLLVISHVIYSVILLEVYRVLGAEASSTKWGISPYFGTFCDNHFCKMTLADMDAQGVPENCRFGNLAFIDAIKGRLLNGLAKTDSRGLPAALGHGTMLDTALRWFNGPRRRIMNIFQCHNYEFLRRSAGINLHFPPCFGGYNLPRLEGEYKYGGTDHSTDLYFRRFVFIYRMTDSVKFLYYISLLKSIRAHSNKDYPVESEDLLKVDFLKGVTLCTPEQAFIKEGLVKPDDWRIQGDMLRDRSWINTDDLNRYLSRQLAANAILVWKKPSVISPSLNSIRKRFKDVWNIIMRGGEIPHDPALVPTEAEISKLPYLTSLRLKSLWCKRSQIDSWFNTSFLSLRERSADIGLRALSLLER
jgi:hypothetical protein